MIFVNGALIEAQRIFWSSKGLFIWDWLTRLGGMIFSPALYENSFAWWGSFQPGYAGPNFIFNVKHTEIRVLCVWENIYQAFFRPNMNIDKRQLSVNSSL